MRQWRIEVGYKEQKTDSIGATVKADIEEDLRIKGIRSVSYIDVYEIDADLRKEEAERIAQKLLIDPITQNYSINSPLISNFDWAIEVKYHKDVTDNVGITAVEGIEDLLGRKFKEPEKVRSRRKYVILGKITENDVKTICKGLLANELIETYCCKKGENEKG